MKVYNYSEARQNFSTVLNTALKEEVIITRRDGSKFKLIAINENKKDLKSPLENIKGIKTNITMDEILKAIQQGREDREYKKDTIL
jgi:antitoxin (DNA-binding transcriptional repressor) of toxin-antitoxin stability system